MNEHDTERERYSRIESVFKGVSVTASRMWLDKREKDKIAECNDTNKSRECKLYTI